MLPFEVARAFVRKLDLGSKKEWEEWSKSGLRPANIPSGPHKVYRDTGWISTPDWLGYGQGKGARQPPPSSSSSRTSSTPRSKKTKKTKQPATAPSRKRAREPDPDRDLDVSSGGPDLTKIKVEVEVEEVGGFSIMSSASDLSHTACGLVTRGPPTS